MSLLRRNADPDRFLKTWTNIGLGIAVLIGLAIISSHGGVRSTAIAAFGAAVGVGGILGFLFGVPSVSNGSVNINDAGAVAVGLGKDSRTLAQLGDGAGRNDPSDTAAIPDGTLKGGPQTANASNLQSPDANYAKPPDPTTSTESISTGTPKSVDQAPYRPEVSNLEQVADWVTKLLLGGGLTQLGRIPPKIWQWSRMVALGIIGDTKSVGEQMIVAQQAFAAGILVYGFVLGFFGGFLITKLQLGKAIL